MGTYVGFISLDFGSWGYVSRFSCMVSEHGKCLQYRVFISGLSDTRSLGMELDVDSFRNMGVTKTKA